jgi:hypothetical protein
MLEQGQQGANNFFLFLVRSFGSVEKLRCIIHSLAGDRSNKPVNCNAKLERRNFKLYPFVRSTMTFVNAQWGYPALMVKITEFIFR